MSEPDKIYIHNKSGKPDNLVLKEARIELKCEEVEDSLPGFLRGYFVFLKGNLLPLSRYAYLNDVRFFFEYLISKTALTEAGSIDGIKPAELAKVRASDVNAFIDFCRRYKVTKNGKTYIYSNDRKSLARKRSSVSVLFKYLYRDELVPKNITDGFDPIKLPKAGDKEIKHLEEEEVMRMLDAVSSGKGLVGREKLFWEKTKKRDRAILVVFVTYGLRLSEVQQLNISSFNFGREDFKVFRKGGKETVMPLNRTVMRALDEYIKTERPPVSPEYQDDADALFLSLHGRRMTERAIRQMVKKYTSIALGTSRQTGYSPHKLRATTATSLIDMGNSIFDVQELLDHSNVTTTQLYAAHRRGAKRDMISGMEFDDV
ncbi:MAG: tyrosine-type recombinase/integrase [Clostridiales Family XIII bacterium]|nr:tyrosine-type recombinase/integrase [Clostridiales Family XIII bacterium]